MIRRINQSYLYLCILTMSLVLPQALWAEALEFRKVDRTGIPSGNPITTMNVDWTSRSSVSWPVACSQGKEVSPVSYQSSNSAIATVNANGAVEVKAYSGTVTITATYTGTAASYDPGSYILTIVDDRSDPKDLNFGFSSTTASATYGDEGVTLPSLNMGQLSGAAVTYSSSVQGVATVDNAGSVTIKGAGSTEISASFAGNDYTKPGSASYTLTVAQKEVGLMWGTTEFTYDGNAHAPTATATGLVGNDACTVTVDGAQTNAGSNYIATASALSNANYKLPATNTTTFSIAKAASSVTKVPTANSLTYTGSAQALLTAGTASGGTMNYSLDNKTFTETIPLETNVGSYTVYYKVVGDANHEDAAGGQVVVSIAKATPTVTFASKTANAKMGETYAGQTATTSPEGLVLKYSSTNTAVATVNESTGAVTLVAAGSTTIKASFEGNTNYNAAEDSYTLTIAKDDAVSADLSFSSQTATATYGDASVTTPTLSNPHQLSLTWSSSKESVATVNSSGAVTIKGAGQTVISAAFAGNDSYSAATISYTLTVNKAAATVTFASKTANAKMGETYAGQTATTSPAGLVLKYSSSNTGVAKVNESTGAVSLVGAGSTTIKASFDGNTNYNAAEDSYTLTVSKADAVEVELSFASDKVTATYGDGTVSAPSLNNPQQLSLTWSSSNVNVATIGNNNKIQIVGAGQTVISAAFAGDDTYQAKTVSFTLTVNKAAVTVTFDTEAETATLGEPFTSPKATITPRDLQLVYSSTDKYIAKVEGSTGEVTLRGVGTVKITATFKGSDNYESASASYELTVLEGTLPPPTLEPIVKEEDYWMDEEFFINADGSEVDLSNTIINDILFTLKNQSSPEGDGYDTEEKCIVINIPTSASTLDALLANGVEPGSEEYASQFTGMTFMVPPGDGYVIVTSQEAEGAYLMAKVGDSEPVAIHMEEMGDYDIPYLSDEITFVYLWKAGTGFSNDVRTRGKKTMSDVKVRGVSHKSKGRSGIQQVYDDAAIDQPWYDLSGQRITKPVKKGVYIHGNRKVVIK